MPVVYVTTVTTHLGKLHIRVSRGKSSVHAGSFIDRNSGPFVCLDKI